MRQAQITDLPGPGDLVRFKPDFGQRFLVTVDTEEEFDWSSPFARSDHSLDSIPRLAKFQQFCEGHGVVPVYLVDYPVVNDPRTAEVLGEAVAQGRAEIGVQLHPWVNPPHHEEITVHNSFAGNLPAELERAKFGALRDAIERNFGAAPLIYRAGRYGVGAETAQILAQAGIAIDTSVRALFDYSSQGGPNFRHHPLVPWWIGRRNGLLELPLTTVFWGLLRQQGRTLHPALWRVPRLRGLLARLGMLERIPLTPEGVAADEALKAIDIALDDGLPLLVFSFHSPSLRPGHTPYVRDEYDLDRFYAWWRSSFDYLASRKVRPTCVREIIAAAEM
ncbi:polysaccharide deacetylase family protein [Novosphingobium sp. Gsoil 351]|uniref:polysaccharide deacetylase family protein n=1 Tax=Novosphingobium sp. Gsoil 351 TaxID=2675225 RepID=UPI0012B4EA31|nr:polysaccharide deacetylase family protein [Novosphingobium sp. Gsoil 351]QGN53234.1 WalW protein [Novosphingobium sp. Gsoil 351]